MNGNITAILNEDETVALVAKQGTTWNLEITLKNDDQTPVDLSGYSARGQIRKNYAAADITASFNCEIKTPATDGKISISLNASTTAGIPAYKDTIDSAKLKKIPLAADGVYVYDIEIFISAEVSRILEGRLYVDPEATR